MGEEFVPQLAYLRDIDLIRISASRYQVNYHGVRGVVSSKSVYNENLQVVILGEADRADVYIVEPTQGRFQGRGNKRGILVPRRHLYLGDGTLDDLWDANALLFADNPPRSDLQSSDGLQVA